MLGNFHTHTTFCDGINTPEEVVLAAIEKGFSAIGFSGHGYTDFDLTYCMKDTDSYILEINTLKEKYKNKIQVYLGAEEDIWRPVDRSRFDYLIGSSHYFQVNGQYLSIDSGRDYFERCLAAFDGDALRLAENYYSNFCRYIKSRKPDIIGHFDLITKYEESGTSYLLCNDKYNKLAEKYICMAAESGCIFEVNMGAVARGIRSGAYPNENLLYMLKKCDSKIILSSDSHSRDTLDFGFEETKVLLKSIGFKQLYTLYDHEFVKYDICPAVT